MGKAFIGNFKGPQGDQGIQGNEGKAASIMIDSVQTLQPEENATVENVGTTSDARLKFGIPRGADGMTDLVARYEDASEYTATPTSDAPIVINDLNGITQQGENPSPDNPQMIHGVGDMGYFDGELLQSGISEKTGNVSGSFGHMVNSANYISVNNGDEVSVLYEENGIDKVNNISIFEYREDLTYNGYTFSDNALIHKTIVKQDTKYIKFDIRKTSSEILTPQTAGHISVTINGKYASRVESRTAQLFDASKLATKTQGGATVTNNGDGSFTISGSGNLNQSFNQNYTYSKHESLKLLKTGTCKLNSDFDTNIIPGFVFGLYYASSNSGVPNKRIYTNQSLTSFEITEEDIENLKSGNYVLKAFFYAYPNAQIKTGTIKPMVYIDGDGIWQPYRHTSIQFPLTSPLYDGDKICYVKPGESYIDENGDTVVADRMLYGVHRENGKVVFDGSEDENWMKSSLRDDLFVIIINNKVISSDELGGYIKCDRLMYINNNSSVSSMPDNSIKADKTGSANRQVFVVVSEAENELSAFKTWLQSNPLTVVYKLAQPYFEPFEDQTPFYNLRSFDNLTYIYSDDPLNPALTVGVAKNQTGGYIFESLAQAMKNAQKAEAMKSLESRIQALESQAVENI